MSQSRFEAADVFIVHQDPTHGYCVVLFEDAKKGREKCVTMPGGQWDKDHSNLPEVASARIIRRIIKIYFCKFRHI